MVTKMNEEFTTYDILYTDADNRETEILRERASLITEKMAKRITESWNKNTWVEGRRYFYRVAKEEISTCET